GGGCESVPPVDCNDNNPDTVDQPCVLDGAAAPICRHTCLNDKACDDGNECNGIETCNKATGACVPGTAGCGGTDECASATCVDNHCVQQTHSAFDGVHCRLDGAANAIGTAADGEVAVKVRTKLGKLLNGIQGKLTAAEQTPVVKKRTKLMHTVKNKINA